VRFVIKPISVVEFNDGKDGKNGKYGIPDLPDPLRSGSRKF
jgi:hypothetical protein